jgi:hypothetical protein
LYTVCSSEIFLVGESPTPTRHYKWARKVKGEWDVYVKLDQHNKLIPHLPALLF